MMKYFSPWGRLYSFIQNETVIVTALYLVPRLLPLGLVALLAAVSGIGGLGQAAVALSLWQFLLVIADYGVGQWLLTKSRISAGEVRTAFRGRAGLALATTAVVGFLGLGDVVSIPSGLFVTLMLGQLLSFGQMAFAWELQQRRGLRASIYGALEYLAPLFAILFFSAPSEILGAIIVSKSIIGVLLTSVSLRGMSTDENVEGLSPRQFGLHSSLWGLTSFASGTGELLLLSKAGSDSLMGAYRLFQTLSSMGSIVGFAAIAPLMRRTTGSFVRIWNSMAALGAASGLLVTVAFIGGYLYASSFPAAHGRWLVEVALALGGAAVLNTTSIVPLSAVARRHGARYNLRIGVVTACVYWLMVAVFAWLDLPLLAPVPVLAAAVVGLAGNILVFRQVSFRAKPDERLQVNVVADAPRNPTRFSK